MLESNELAFQLVRSKRKTLALQVKQGKVVVRAPSYLCESVVERFVKSKHAWLVAKIREQREQELRIIRFVDGESIPYLGIERTLRVEFGCEPSVHVNEHFITVCLSNRIKRATVESCYLEKKVESVFNVWLKQQAEVMITAMAERHANRMSLTFVSLKFKRYRARWGSCNNRGEISFNYLLLMCPEWVISYVVVHELSHLTHLNHSANFWQLVAMYSPEYQKAQHWLKDHSYFIR